MFGKRIDLSAGETTNGDDHLPFSQRALLCQVLKTHLNPSSPYLYWFLTCKKGNKRLYKKGEKKNKDKDFRWIFHLEKNQLIIYLLNKALLDGKVYLFIFLCKNSVIFRYRCVSFVKNK